MAAAIVVDTDVFVSAILGGGAANTLIASCVRGPNLRDESDNHLVELAVAGGAEAIVTRNVRDFVVGAELRFPQIRIVTPTQFLRS